MFQNSIKITLKKCVVFNKVKGSILELLLIQIRDSGASQTTHMSNSMVEPSHWMLETHTY